MANAVGTIRKIKNDFLTCGICLENLNKPKCLACLHKFCEGCLEAYVIKKVKVSVSFLYGSAKFLSLFHVQFRSGFVRSNFEFIEKCHEEEKEQ